MGTISRLIISLLFVIAMAWYVNITFGHLPNAGFLILATVFGAYMAMNIGANDAANNVGPLVGSGAVTLGGAILIAFIFEFLGAFIAGGDVVGTIKDGIVSQDAFGGNRMIFVYAMSASLLAGAIWLNIATYIKAPVSTTHSIVGGVIGAGIVAGGFAVVSWAKVGSIVASWIISPILGGIFAALFLLFIKKTVIYKENQLDAAKKIVPLLISFMVTLFITYLIYKGVKNIWSNIVAIFSFLPQEKKPSLFIALLIGLFAGVGSYFYVKPKFEQKISNSSGELRANINTFFNIPLIFSAALLSFAHGSNDRANAIGPLAAVNDAITNMTISVEASLPLWVTLVGALGLSVGLTLFGAKLIKLVGSEITDLDQIRVFAITVASGFVVLLASELGMPVSSTHIAIGAVFGVGFMREWLGSKQQIGEEKQELHIEIEKHDDLKLKLENCDESDYKTRLELTNQIKQQKKIVKKLKKALRDQYVKTEMIKKIITSWVVTVPISAILGAIIFLVIKGAVGV
ncbi:MAG: inorganic phosphate transporter [Sulfurovaceae bacterium]|nr:inorganic phosphate transporter [Sulfurovaceae bacterium]